MKYNYNRWNIRKLEIFIQSFCPIYWKDNSRNMSSNNRDTLRRLFEGKINLVYKLHNKMKIMIEYCHSHSHWIVVTKMYEVVETQLVDIPANLGNTGCGNDCIWNGCLVSKWTEYKVFWMFHFTHLCNWTFIKTVLFPIGLFNCFIEQNIFLLLLCLFSSEFFLFNR